MAEGVKTAEEKAAEARRGPARRGGPPHMTMGQPGGEVAQLRPVGQAPARPPAARTAARSSSCSSLAVVSVALSSIGPKILGRATDLIFAGVIGRQLGQKCRRARRRSRSSRGCAPAATTTYGRHAEHVDFVAGQGIDFGAVADVLLLVTALYVASSLLMWVQGWILQGVLARTMYRPAPGGRGQAQPAAAALLRQPAARRDPQPGHERHRQRRAVAAADALAAAQLAAHRHRRARHDVLDLVGPRAHRARHASRSRSS